MSVEIIDFRVRPSTAYFFRDLVPTVIPAFRKYEKLFHIGPRLVLTSLEDFVKHMASSSVGKGVLFSPDAAGNLEVHKACKQFPDHFYGLAGIDISAGSARGVEDLQHAYEDLGLFGLSLSPFLSGIVPDDPRCYPLYELSEKMGKMVQIHSAVHFNPAVPPEISHPGHIDRIAADFPNLRIVMCHAGLGFDTMGLSIVEKHPNMFAEFSGFHPRATDRRFVEAIDGDLKDKVIFGTTFPCLDFNIAGIWKKMLSEEAQLRFFHDNARRALGLGE